MGRAQNGPAGIAVAAFDERFGARRGSAEAQARRDRDERHAQLQALTARLCDGENVVGLAAQVYGAGVRRGRPLYEQVVDALSESLRTSPKLRAAVAQALREPPSMDHLQGAGAPLLDATVAWTKDPIDLRAMDSYFDAFRALRDPEDSALLRPLAANIARQLDRDLHFVESVADGSADDQELARESRALIGSALDGMLGALDGASDESLGAELAPFISALTDCTNRRLLTGMQREWATQTAHGGWAWAANGTGERRKAIFAPLAAALSATPTPLRYM